MADTERGWSELPSDLLELIAGAFTEISDHLRFRSVCRSWRSANTYLPLPRASPWPWLLLLPIDGSEEDDCHVISPFDGWRRFTLRTPYSDKMKSCDIHGSPYGCFLVIDDVNMSISINNPLVSGSWFTLPPLLPMVEYNWKRAKIVRDEDSKLNVIVSVGDSVAPFLWRAGDSTWTRLYERNDMMYDFFLYKGNFYVEECVQTVVIESTTLTQTYAIEHPDVDMHETSYLEHFLVESSSGDLLMLVWNTFHDMCIFRLDLSKQQPDQWVRVKSIGHDTLFLDDRGIMCFPTGRYGGFRTNCVYFISTRDEDDYMEDCEVCLFNIEDDTVEFLQLHIGARRPVWVIPRR